MYKSLVLLSLHPPLNIYAGVHAATDHVIKKSFLIYYIYNILKYEALSSIKDNKNKIVQYTRHHYGFDWMAVFPKNWNFIAELCAL